MLQILNKKTAHLYKLPVQVFFCALFVAGGPCVD